MKGWDLNSLEKLKAKGMVQDIEPVKKISKYGNRKTKVEDITFDSNKEAARYQVLKHWQDVGAISNLECQKKFELNQGGTHSLVYIADFSYLDNVIREQITEDVKGFLTREYRKKRRLMKKVWKITIKET